jgi:hypothetical protein
MLVNNIPPVPEGFDPDSVQLGQLPIHKNFAYFHPAGSVWKETKVFGGLDFTGIFCLPLKPWYPPAWYDSNGNLLPDVYEHDPKKWPEHVGPDDWVEALFDYDRRVKKSLRHPIKASGLNWGVTVAYRKLSKTNQS